MKRTNPPFRPVLFGVALLLLLALIGGLAVRWGSTPPIAYFVDPWDGFYRTARLANPDASMAVNLPSLSQPVEVVRDERGVPHIYAEDDLDAVRALGYIVAQDRLFQLDFIPRVAAGRLAEAFGPSAVGSDRFLRRTGMAWGAERTLAILQEDPQTLAMLEAYADGVNAYRTSLAPEDLPFEFRLLGYEPDAFTPLHTVLLLQYMNYDLSWGSDRAAYGALREVLDDSTYSFFFPRFNDLVVPIIPVSGASLVDQTATAQSLASNRDAVPEAGQVMAALRAWKQAQQSTALEGYIRGKGSNNWVVSGARSATGRPILAGDMHLSLTLPAIWYEVHLKTPNLNTYGVTIAGSPLPVEAFNDHVAWAFTNTGSDQIDHYALRLDESGDNYWHNDAWKPLERRIDTLFVNGGESVLDTLEYAHWGPVIREDGEAIALRWTAHEPSTTLKALNGMNRATSYAEFEQALRNWDTPMQNIAVATTEGTIAIRSTGYLPIRQGNDGAGLLDGTSDAHMWTGRVPFDDLPRSINPDQGFLTSTNQQPTDPSYPYYLGHDWGDAYRSLRIDTLLRAKDTHTLADIQSYQSDVVAMQHVLFTPLIADLDGLSPRADSLRQMLAAWDGTTAIDRSEPLVLYVFMRELSDAAWDEALFDDRPEPNETRLYQLLTKEPSSVWLDVEATPEVEDGPALLRLVLERTAKSMADTYGWDPAAWTWGEHHQLRMRHLTQSEALRPLWREGMPYPGFRATLSPASGLNPTHSASWRVVVDFSTTPPTGYGVYPGGQQGNPFGAFYDTHISTFTDFQYYTLRRPASPDAHDAALVSSTLTLRP